MDIILGDIEAPTSACQNEEGLSYSYTGKVRLAITKEKLEYILTNWRLRMNLYIYDLRVKVFYL